MALPIRVHCGNRACKHHDRVELVKAETAPGTTIVLVPAMFCGNCGHEVVVDAPRWLRDEWGAEDA